jgi:PKD repeat protein
VYGPDGPVPPGRFIPIAERFGQAVEFNAGHSNANNGYQLAGYAWDFGDGQASNERHPLHRYEKGGEFTVTLWIEGPAGKPAEVSTAEPICV